ncbi:putative parvulin-type peptidyl-prolyl cis-trans isomerase [Gammaproteobacteria bacterium]
MLRYCAVLILSSLLFNVGTPALAAGSAKKPVFSNNTVEKNFAAKVNDAIISKRDVDQVFKGNPNLTDNKQNRRAITDELVARELIIQAAKEKNLDKNSEVRDAIVASTHQILFAAGADDYLKENPIRDSAAREQYENWVKNYPKEEFKVRRILLKTQEEAERIASRIKEGKPFAELASQSLDTESAKNGGDIGWIAPMSPETAQQLSNLNVGKVSDPIEATNGWEVVEVMDKRPAHPPEYSQIKDRILNAMKQELLRRYVQELRTKANIIIP